MTAPATEVMRFGIGVVPRMAASEVADLASLAENLGFHGFYVPDQTFHRDPFTVLTLCALATKRIRLGLGVANPFTRHPVQIARAAGVLAEISNGRFILGYGAGNAGLVRSMGQSQTGTVDRLRAAIEVTRMLLRGDVVQWDSPGMLLRDVRLDFTPGIDIPIFLGTHGSKILRLAGEIADGVFLEGLLGTSGYTYALAQLAAGGASVDRPANMVEKITWVRLGLSKDRDICEQPEYQHWARLLLRSMPPPVRTELGLGPHEDGRKSPGPVNLEPRVVRELLLIGTPSEVRDRLLHARSRGVPSVGIILFGGYDEINLTMRQFARDVMASFQ